MKTLTPTSVHTAPLRSPCERPLNLSMQTVIQASTLARLRRAQKSAADLFLASIDDSRHCCAADSLVAAAEVTIISFNVATIVRNVFRRRPTTTALLTY